MYANVFKAPRLGVVLALPLLLAAQPAPGVQAPPAGGMFDLYAANRAEGVPNFITEDFLLLAYSMIRQQADVGLERDVLAPAYGRLLQLFSAALEGGEGPVRTADRQFIALLGALLRNDCGPPQGAARAEWDLIQAAGGMAPSPLWGAVMDYGQFAPRGRYADDPAQAGFFRSFRYAGAVLFAVKPSAATGVNPEQARRMAAQALELAGLMRDNAELAEAYADLERRLTWLFGSPDDLVVEDLWAVMDRVTGEAGDPAAALFDYARQRGRQPRILGGVVDAARLEPDLTPHDVLTGWRFLPQRYSADGGAFQQLVFDATGPYLGDCDGCPRPFTLSLIDGREVKGFPSARELMALLGSGPAQAQAKRAGEDRFEGYAGARERAKKELASAQGLQRDQLLLMRRAFAGGGTEARLNAMLGFWTWQRYLGLLYTKQSYTVTGKSLSLPGAARPGATLEPSTDLYLALRYLVSQHQARAPSRRFGQFALALDRCIGIAYRIEAGGTPDASEQRFLNDLDEKLLALTGGMDRPVVVDVHTNPAERTVLEEGVGHAAVTSTVAGARGVRFTHYEFKQPLARRLTDTAWRERLKGSGAVSAAAKESGF